MGGISATSAAVHTAWTPLFASAARASIDCDFPCAKFERTTRICSCPGNDMSAANRRRTVNSVRSSRHGSERPMCCVLVCGRAIGSAPPQFGGGRANGFHDILVARAAAQVGRKHIDEVFVADFGILLQYSRHQHQKSRCAKAALQPVMLHESALQSV